MFITLLAVTFIIAFAVSFIVTVIFKKPLDTILQRIVDEEIGQAWSRYLTFAIYVVGISAGVRVWDLEKYITPLKNDTEIIVLNLDRWILEVYRTIIGTLQGIAWMLLVFFVFSLIAYVIIRIFEARDPSIK
ncbi:MAG: hypothetical protein ABIJ42_00355, partial [Acidobacteriota bacterium]